MSDRIQNRREFLAQSGMLASAAALPAAITGCSSEDDPPAVEPNLEWEDTADGLEQSPLCCWTGDADEVAEGSPSVGAHLPEISIDTVDGRLRATVFTLGDEAGNGQVAPHPMVAAHWLTVMYVRNQAGVVVYLRDFGQEQIKQQYLNQDPRFSFDVPPGTTWLRAYSFCNLHQHWRGRRVDIESS